MTDPIRWCDDASSAGELERDVLRSDLDVEPPANVSAVVWGKLAGELGLGSALVGVAAVETLHGASGAQAAGIAATHTAKAVLPAAGSSLAFVQGVVVGVLACGAVWAGVTLPTRGGTALEAQAPSVAAAPAPGAPARASAREAQAVTPSQELVAPKALSPTLGSSRTPPERAQETATRNGRPAPSVATFGEVAGAPQVTPLDRQSQLKDEAALLRRARAQLRAGQLNSALALLAESKRRFATPELYQEREALLIELLARTGQTAEATQRARTFLKAFPESPHADRLRTFANL